jgi:hypothetical protein
MTYYTPPLVIKIVKPSCKNRVNGKLINGTTKKASFGVKTQKMVYKNDCAIAAAATALKLPYRTVLKHAIKELGFLPNGTHGVNVGELIWECGYEFALRMRRERPNINKFNADSILSKRTVSNKKPVRLPVKSVQVFSVKSVNVLNAFHAVVRNNGMIFDPTKRRSVSKAMFVKLNRNAYYDTYDDTAKPRLHVDESVVKKLFERHRKGNNLGYDGTKYTVYVEDDQTGSILNFNTEARLAT